MQVASPHLGLRDFLFYLVPGAIVVLAAILALQVGGDVAEKWDSLGGSLAAVLISYAIGHAVYPIAYPIRWLFSPAGDWRNREEEFLAANMKLLKENSEFYTAVVFRDRSLARFSSAMVFPCFGVGLAFARLTWPSSEAEGLLCGLLGFLFSAGFVFRFRRYDRRYRHNVWSNR